MTRIFGRGLEATMADQFYYFENDTQQGPVDRDILVVILTSRLTPDTLVWREGLAEWVPAGQLPEFASLFAGRPAAPGRQPPSLNPFTVFGRSFSWKGKFNRGEFIVATIANSAVGIIMGILIGIAVALGTQSVAMIAVAGLLGLVLIPVMTISGLGAVVRRVHDLGVSPWLILLAMVPIANFVWFVYLFVAPGNPQAPAVQPIPVGPIAVVVGIVVLSFLATITAIAIPALLAARQRAAGVNMNTVSAAVSGGLQSQLSLAIATVACPTETRPMKAGDVFDCVATPAIGGRLTVKVTQEDDQGNVKWEIARTEGLIDLRVVERSVVSGLKEQAGVDAAVTCGGKYLASTAGEVFECKAKATDGREGAIAVTITDALGNISWAVK
jgi:uncharacterized membrane protein YhaH (DUF805 family)